MYTAMVYCGCVFSGSSRKCPKELSIGKRLISRIAREHWSRNNFCGLKKKREIEMYVYVKKKKKEKPPGEGKEILDGIEGFAHR